jgi:hypothetical protein
MNTIVIINKRAKPLKAANIRDHKGLAFFLNPGSLHAEGEEYLYTTAGLVQIVMSEDSSPNVKKQEDDLDRYMKLSGFTGSYHLRPTDLILPRGIQDELHQLASEYLTFFVRTPAIGLGSHKIILKGDFDNMMLIKASNNRSTGKSNGRQP